MKARGSDIERYRCRDAKIRGDRYKRQVEELKETITALERENLKLTEETDNIFDFLNKHYPVKCTRKKVVNHITTELTQLRADLARWEQAVKNVRERYPTDVFPETGTSQDSQSARLCRQTCDNIVAEQQALKETGEGE